MTGADTNQTSARDQRFWEQHARSYDRSLRVLRGPLPRMLELTCSAVADAQRVLEVAAGTGLVTIAIASSVKELVATDYAQAMVATVRQRVISLGLQNVHCERADLYALPFGTASFDAVVAANVLHLVPDLPGALDALRAVLKPGGRLVVPTFCHDETLFSKSVSRVLSLTGFPGHRRFTCSSLRDALQKAGMRIEQLQVLNGVIPIGYAHGTFL